MPVITIMLILKVGNILNLAMKKSCFFILRRFTPQRTLSALMYTGEGVVNQNYSFATAVNLFTSVISLILVLGTNKITKN